MSSGAPDNGSDKPRLHSARSFPRMDNADASPLARSRAKTVQSVAITESVAADALPLSTNDDEQGSGPDVFEKTASPEVGLGEDGQQEEEGSVLSRSIQGQPEELPVELASLTDRFVNSLSAKVHSSPPTIDKISNMYQDFYIKAESHIATHISALASRINRDPGPAPTGGTPSKTKNKDVDNTTPGRQMLTASEVTERRQARKLLSSKRLALEEAVERRACESIYDKLWRHKSTLDEVRDEKLRSKTAALLLVGINLKDLGVDVDMTSISPERQKEVDEGLSLARDYLAKMDQEKFPLGKLQHLAAAHKAIVDALTKLLPSSSSADEILPTLIYSLVTCPPEGINIISNLYFIQRFRSSGKIDGETAYCLTNLEAAISFLENVDLSELRSEDLPEGTKASLKAIEPLPISAEASVSSAPADASGEFSKPSGKESASNSLPRRHNPASTQQRLNNIFQPPSKVLGAANDVVRNTADQGLKNIGASLDSSFNFLFGRLKELQSSQPAGKEGGNPVLPKTLAEARRLVTSPVSGDQNSAKEDSPAQSTASNDRPPLRRIGSKAEDAFLGLVTGQRTPRDRSVDSVRTQGSGRKTAAGTGSIKDEPSSGTSQGLAGSSQPPTPLESMRNFGNTLNPLNHIPGMIRNFGRPGADGSGGVATPSEKERPVPGSREVSSGSLAPSTKIDPPIQRFLQTQNADELTIRDVAALLEDYKRISAILLKQDSNAK